MSSNETTASASNSASPSKDKTFKPTTSKLVDLLTKANSLKTKDHKLSEQLLNLISLYSQSNLEQKLKFLSIKFHLYHTLNHESTLLIISNKYLKYIYSPSFENDILLQYKTIILSQLYQLIMLLKQKNNHYLSYFFCDALLHSKLTPYIKDTLRIKLSSTLTEVFKSINALINEEKVKYKSKHFHNELKHLKAKFIDKKYSFPLEKKENCYLISTGWIKSFILFLHSITTQEHNGVDYNKLIDKNIQSSRTCKLFYMYFDNFINQNEEDYAKMISTYPGPINNYFIVKQCDHWEDPKEDEKYSNVYLSNKAIENDDFKYVDQDTYVILKGLFGVNYELERKLINNDYYEVYLLRFKVLILSPELMKHNYYNLIRVRNFQTSKNKTLKELKEKIMRCVNYEITLFNSNTNSNSNKEQVNLFPKPKFHIVNLELTSETQSNDIYNIVNCYLNNYATFKQKLKGIEITQDDILLETLKLGEKDLLIVEIVNDDKKTKKQNSANTNTNSNSTNNNNNTLQWFIQLKTIEDYLKCSLCSNPITGNKINCDNCDNYIYCSEDCKKNDIKHITHHKNLDTLYKRKFALHDMLSVDISTIITSTSRHGLTGLKNLGNTCFMNSALQCLSNCEELTKYFLLKKYKDEINKKNKYGSGGAIAKAYFDLIEQSWNGNNTCLNPYSFRQIFVSFVKQFVGLCQHDSHEVLSFMLDALHEDLNRVKTKPYTELNERWENETEEEASLRWWKNHVDRENSIIVDLFHGQFKSVVRCPQCKRVNTIYDPFMYLGLPIPTPQNKIRVKLIIDDDSVDKTNFSGGVTNIYGDNEIKIFVCYFNCSDDTTVREIKSKLMSEIEKMSRNNLISKMKNVYVEGVVCDQNKNIKKYLNNDYEKIINFYSNGYETVFYKMEQNGTQCMHIFTSPIYIKNNKIHPQFYPKIFTFNTSTSIREVYYALFVYYRKLFSDIKHHSYTDFIDNKDNVNYVNDEFNDYLEVKDAIPFKLHIVNNVPHKAPFSCEYCNRSCDYCPFNFKFSQSVLDMKKSQKIERAFIVYVEVISPSKKAFVDKDINPTSKNFKNGLMTKNQDITIYDCLEAFRTEEKLEKENSWYCSTCKSHQEAYKKLEIFRAPNILIIQLKRFKIKNANIYSGLMQNKKNECLIVFPINDLDLRQYIVEENSRKEGIYDLYAISQHFGSLNSGHYTALCKNSGKWYDFDDERVSAFDSANVVSKSAYLLFYRKKNLSKT